MSTLTEAVDLFNKYKEDFGITMPLKWAMLITDKKSRDELETEFEQLHQMARHTFNNRKKALVRVERQVQP